MRMKQLRILFMSAVIFFTVCGAKSAEQLDGIVLKAKGNITFLAPAGMAVYVSDGKQEHQFTGKGFEVADSLTFSSAGQGIYQITFLSVENITFLPDINSKYGKGYYYEAGLGYPMIIVFNNNLVGFDVNNSRSLRYLSVMQRKGRRLKELDVSHNPKLEELYCSGHGLKKLDVSKNKKLRILWCAQNRIAKLNISNNRKLEELVCWGNQITSLNTRKNKRLTFLSCSRNNLGSINITHNPELETFICRRSRLKKLDVRKNKKLQKVIIEDNEFSARELNNIFRAVEPNKNPRNFFIIDFHGNPGSDSCDRSILKSKGWY